MNIAMKSKFLQSLAIALISAPLLVACASTQPSGYTVAQALAAPDDTKVVVTGDVVQQTDKKHLLLRDGSGQITVEVDPDILGEVKFAPDSEIRIAGHINRNSERSVLVAKTVQVVK
jgi:uncharacterized protein (TIGR00156 family)